MDETVLDSAMEKDLLQRGVVIEEIRKDARHEEAHKRAWAVSESATPDDADEKLDAISETYTTLEKMLNALRSRFGDVFIIGTFREDPSVEKDLSNLADDTSEAFIRMMSLMADRAAREYVASLSPNVRDALIKRMIMLDEQEMRQIAGDEDDEYPDYDSEVNETGIRAFKEALEELRREHQKDVAEHGQGYGLPLEEKANTPKQDDWVMVLKVRVAGEIFDLMA